jgi:hypothetical protein
MSREFLLIREVLAEVVRTGRPVITRNRDVEAIFGGTEGFLLALHRRWRIALHARLDALLEDPPDDLDASVVALWTDPTVGGRGLRALVDAHLDQPALAAAQERERLAVFRDLGVDVPESGHRARLKRRAGRRWWRRAG